MLAGEIELVAFSIRDRYGKRKSQAVPRYDLPHVRPVSGKEEAVRAATYRVWLRHRLFRATEKKESQKDLE